MISIKRAFFRFFTFTAFLMSGQLAYGQCLPAGSFSISNAEFRSSSAKDFVNPLLSSGAGVGSCTALKKVKLFIKLDLGEDYEYGDNTWFVEVGLYVRVRDASNTLFFEDYKSITINQEEPEKLWVLEYPNVCMFYFSERAEFSWSFYWPFPEPMIENDIRLTAWYEYDWSSSVSGASVALNPAISANPAQFQWQSTCDCTPNYEFQLLRLYNTDPGQTDDNHIITKIDWSKALTIETQSSNPSLVLTLTEGTGFYAWRVRPIGTQYPGGIANSQNWGAWSNGSLWNSLGDNPIELIESVGTITCPSPPADFTDTPFMFYNQFDDNRNWIYSRTFSEAEDEGKVKISEQITYANGLLQVVQNQSHLFSHGNVLANQTVFDYTGRPALSTLYAPVNQNALGYVDGLLTIGSADYQAQHFDQTGNFQNPVAANAGAIHSYYTNNADKTIPNAGGYPYSRTLFYGDGTGRIREMSGIGEDLRMGSEHTSRYFYSGVSDQELVRVFGDEAPKGSSVIKMVAIDPNKTATVTYQDKDGQVLATCLSKNGNQEHHLPLSSQTAFTVRDTIDNDISCGDHCLLSSKTLSVNESTNLQLHYTIDPNTWEEICTNLCQTCDYRVEFRVARIDDACDPNFPKTATLSLEPRSCIPGGALPSWSESYSLVPGTYLIERKIHTYTIDPVTQATPSPTAPLGTPYIDQQIESVKTQLESDIANNSLWQTIVSYLENGQSNDLHEWLQVNHGLDEDAVEFSFTAGCCDFVLPLRPCPDCPFEGNDFEEYFLTINPFTSVSATPWADNPATAVLEHLPGYAGGEFNQLIQNMVAEGYTRDTLCKCWTNIVHAWPGLYQADTGNPAGPVGAPDYEPDLLQLFLDCTGRIFLPPSSPPVTIDKFHAYQWQYTSGSSPDCETAVCNGSTISDSPFFGINCSVAGIDWSSLTQAHWESFYACAKAVEAGSIITPPDPADLAGFVAGLQAECNAACDDRFTAFVDALLHLYTIEMGRPMAPDCDPATDPDCVTYSLIYCQATKLVELCKQGCQSLSPIYDNGTLVGFDLTNLEDVQQAMYFAFELTTLGAPCPLTSDGYPFVSTESVPFLPIASTTYAQLVADFLNSQLSSFLASTVVGATFNVSEALDLFSPGLGALCWPKGSNPDKYQMLPVKEGDYFEANGCAVYFISDEKPQPRPILVCEDLCAYETLDCSDLCLRWIPPTIPDDTFSIEPYTCEEQTSDFGLAVLYDQMASCVQLKLDVYESNYYSQCLDPGKIKDTFTMSYQLGYYHYTLYKYDRAGNLVATIPPEGVEANDTYTRMTHPTHAMQTRYEYNSLRQLIWQFTPDGGETRFIYDKLGQLRFSQNARQAAEATFAYTKYDYLGRVVEVGKAALGSNTWADMELLADDASFPNAGPLTERIFTYYTQPYSGTLTNGYAQDFLLNRVSYTISDQDGDLGTPGDQVTSVYSYDPHGNVQWFIQDVMSELQLSSPATRRFVTEYEYDLISNKVTRLNFMRGRAEQFFTRYRYDEDNRITQVETSRDGYIWDRDARYSYYPHGPLRRTLLGEDRIQGMDYVYTIQGWLKSINHPRLTPGMDPGQDGFGSSKVAKDAFASGLVYFNGDFKNTGSPFQGAGFAYTGFAPAKQLYNGNIALWVSNSAVADPNFRYTGLTGRAFQYDELNRLIISDFRNWDGGAWQNPRDYDSGYGYDGNGNIKLLRRYAFNPTPTPGIIPPLMDNLTYAYNTGPNRNNRLLSVTDAATAATFTGDLDGVSTYAYDETGNLTADPNNGIANIEWNLMGKVRRVTKTDGTVLEFLYDATGHRTLKKVTPAGGQPQWTWYARDASGNMLATYSRQASLDGGYSVRQEEAMLYGSQRLGVWNRAQVAFNLNVSGGGYAESFPLPPIGLYSRQVTQKAYELTDHLGNVRMTLSDVKLPDGPGFKANILSASEYYPFGMLMPERNVAVGGFRFGWNTQERIDEINGSGNHYTAEFWEFSARPVLRWNLDPITISSVSPYFINMGNPILNNDPFGDCSTCPRESEGSPEIYFGGTFDAITISANREYGPTFDSFSSESINGGYTHSFSKYKEEYGLPRNFNYFQAKDWADRALKNWNIKYGLPTESSFENSYGAWYKTTNYYKIDQERAASGLLLGGYVMAAQLEIFSLSNFFTPSLSGPSTFGFTPGLINSNTIPQGGLNLYKGGAPQTIKNTGWKSGDYMLYLPNKGTPKLNWKANYGALRREMALGKPIFDSYRSGSGQLIGARVWDPIKNKYVGEFLNAERYILKSRGWIYNPSSGAWMPTGF